MERDAGERVAELLAGLRRQFIAELPERCDHLEELVLTLERAFDRAAFDDLFRQVHSLKGAGGTHGLPLLTTLCHQFETLLSGWEGGDAVEVASQGDLALRYIDLLRQVPAAGEGELEGELEALLQSRRGTALQLLVVDSLRLTASLCRAAFEPLEADVRYLEDGLQALQELLHVRYDGLIIGGELSGINGLSVVAALRYSSCSNSRIPVVVVTSRSTPPPEHLAVTAQLPRNAALVEALQTHLQPVLKRG